MPFLVFAGNSYYPSGGYHDYIGTFGTVEAALLTLLKGPNAFDWWHIVQDNVIVARSS